MDYLENVDVRSCNWLFDKIKEDKEFLGKCNLDSDEGQAKASYVLKVLDGMIKNDGSTKVRYSKRDHHGILRDYSNFGVQCLPTMFRGLICRHMTDVDMKNCHPVILRHICKRHDISCAYLDAYVTNRDEMLEKYGKETKQGVIKSMNKGTSIKASGWLGSFDMDMKRIQKELYALNEYERERDIANQKPYNKVGRFISFITTAVEVEILHHILAEPKVKVGVLMFDGFMFEGEPPDDYLSYLTERTLEKTGIEMEWVYKEHNMTLDVPADYTPVERSLEALFLDAAAEFEQNHCLITGEGVYIKHGEDDNVIMNLRTLKDCYRHLTYGHTKRGNSFINAWAEKNPDIRAYDTMNIYPKASLCPHNCFNLWTPFPVERVKDHVESVDAVERFVNLVDILCDHHPVSREYMLDWFGHMFQYPEQKSTMPTIVSKEGAGKGTLIDILTKMMGTKKVLMSSTPSRDVFGSFNSQMSDAFLVNLNEISAKEMVGAEGYMKQLITDNTITINTKGVKQVTVRSYCRFITTTNTEEAVKPSKGDRRNIMLYAAEDLVKVGKSVSHIAIAEEKIAGLRKIIDDWASLRSIYDYLMGRKGLDGFGTQPPPITEYQLEQQLLTMPPIEQWLRDWVIEQTTQTVTLHPSDTYELFTKWVQKNIPHHNCTKQQFGVRLNRLRVKGITKMENKYRDWNFNILQIGDSLNIEIELGE